ncbi:MAG: DUF1353 domain-containing protein [Actinomycetota bacterium]
MSFDPNTIRLDEDGDKFWLLTASLSYTDPSGKTHLVPDPCVPLRIPHFRTDLASIPGIFTWFVPTYGVHTKAAVVHDFLCQTLETKEDRFDADKVFRDGLRELKVKGLRRFFMGSAVSWGSMLGVTFLHIWSYLLLVLAYAGFWFSPFWRTFPSFMARWAPAICFPASPRRIPSLEFFACPVATIGLTGLAYLLLALIPAAGTIILASLLVTRFHRAPAIYTTAIATIVALPILVPSLLAGLVVLLYRLATGPINFFKWLWKDELGPALLVPRFVLTGAKPSDGKVPKRRGRYIESLEKLRPEHVDERSPKNRRIMALLNT